MVKQFLESWLSRKLPNGLDLKVPAVDPYKLLSGWHQKYDLSLPLAGVEVTDVKGWAAALTPNDRIFEIFGSYSYRTGMSVLERELNLAKMRIFLGHRTMGDEPWKKAIVQAAAGHMGGATKVLGNIKEVSMTI